MTDTFGTSYNQMAHDLQRVGVQMPLGGYAPGQYSCRCGKCARRFDGDKRACVCLPCAVKVAIATGSESQDAARDQGRRQGFFMAIEDMRGRAEERWPSRVIALDETLARKAREA